MGIAFGSTHPTRHENLSYSALTRRLNTNLLDSNFPVQNIDRITVNFKPILLTHEVTEQPGILKRRNLYLKPVDINLIYSAKCGTHTVRPY